MVLLGGCEEHAKARHSSSKTRQWVVLGVVVVVVVAICVGVGLETWGIEAEEWESSTSTATIQRLLLSHVGLTRLAVVTRQLAATSSSSSTTRSSSSGGRSASFTRVAPSTSATASTAHERYRSATQQRGNMEVVLVPVHQDNYAYLLIDKSSNVAAAVDPAEPTKVLAAANERNLNITTILTTHHHWDHADGNAEMVSLLGGADRVQVVGGDTRIPALSHKVGDNDTFHVGSLSVKVIFSPCHTTGHVMYFVEAEGSDPALFSGDTLFLAGCGRFFEGTAEQMHQAICVRVPQLPGTTRLYCGHEYSVSNLRFALRVDANNVDVQQKLAWAEQQREQGLPTVPSTLAEEASYNPFMRVNTDAIKSAVALPSSASSVEAMHALRDLKNKQ